MMRLAACGHIARAGQPCAICRRRFDRERGNSSERGYGSAWQPVRRAQLRRQPICQYVAPDGTRCRRRATDVDHVLRRALGGSDEPANLQSLCHAHHSAKTAAEVGWSGGPR